MCLYCVDNPLYPNEHQIIVYRDNRDIQLWHVPNAQCDKINPSLRADDEKGAHIHGRALLVEEDIIYTIYY